MKSSAFRPLFSFFCFSIFALNLISSADEEIDGAALSALVATPAFIHQMGVKMGPALRIVRIAKEVYYCMAFI